MRTCVVEIVINNQGLAENPSYAALKMWDGEIKLNDTERTISTQIGARVYISNPAGQLNHDSVSSLQRLSSFASVTFYLLAFSLPYSGHLLVKTKREDGKQNERETFWLLFGWPEIIWSLGQMLGACQLLINARFLLLSFLSPLLGLLVVVFSVLVYFYSL